MSGRFRFKHGKDGRYTTFTRGGHRYRLHAEGDVIVLSAAKGKRTLARVRTAGLWHLAIHTAVYKAVYRRIGRNATFDEGLALLEAVIPFANAMGAKQ